MAAQCLISLGANIGDRAHTIEEALGKLASQRQVQVIRTSRLYETRPIGGPPGQSGFLNGAAVVRTSLSPAALLGVLLRVETEAGRTRAVRWGARPLDLDLLLYEGFVLAEPPLRIPHPRMAWRRFVLEPAAEIAPEMVHPETGWSIGQLLAHLDTTPYYLAITGSIGAGKTELARRITDQEDMCWIHEEINLDQLGAFYSDPPSLAWPVELEFLNQRTRLLAADAEFWQDRSVPVVSDFWFEQSDAFARIWLVPEQYARFRARFEAARQRVVRPRLIVLLEATGSELRERVCERGRTCERGLTAGTLERLGQAIDQQTRQPHVGPVLRMSSDNLETVTEEVSAAVLAMA